MLPTLLPFLLFAFVAAITPGPTNILVLSHSAHFGFKAAIPIIFGACMGAALIVLVVGCGFGQALIRLPMLQLAMQWIGILWLSYLAWQIFRAPVQAFNPQSPDQVHYRLGLWAAGGLQLINPKTWMMALAVSTVFAGSDSNRTAHVAVLSITFLMISLPCLGVWALLGSGATRFFRSPKMLKHLNPAFSILLLISAWSVIWL